MIKIPESHLDHGLTTAQIDYIVAKFADRNGGFIETIELPPELGTVPCALYGPAMGDLPVSSERIFWKVRGERKYPSRLIDKPTRPTRKVTVIAGPYGNHSCVLFTAFGGHLAPKECDDPTLSGEEERTNSVAFWAEHALSVAG